jgi:hypothetical protein
MHSRIGQEDRLVLNFNRSWAIMLLVSIGLFSTHAWGQQTLTGSVIDKSGNPVVGIEVWGRKPML